MTSTHISMCVHALKYINSQHDPVFVLCIIRNYVLVVSNNNNACLKGCNPINKVPPQNEKASFDSILAYIAEEEFPKASYSEAIVWSHFLCGE